MKTKTILFYFLLILSIKVNAQFVTIPDSHFVNWLNTNIPSAMVGNQMDTSNVAITSRTSINISFDTLCNLNGIQYFTSLQILDCSYNQLDTLVNLPNSLQTLICNNNMLLFLPIIPDSVTFFNCSMNRLSILPNLPLNLIHFNCSMNRLDSLPSLPINLIHFDCHNNQLINIATLPSSIMYFDCSGNQLTSLPSLPPSLPSLNCAENQLSSLPTLPTSITSIYCENNLLTSLPVLPSSLDTLSCGSNLLTNLPILSSTLIDLECYYNQLTALPILPSSIQTIVCGGNLLTVLPTLPSSLITLKCYENQLSFLPSLPSSLYYLDCNTNLITSLPALSGSLSYLDCGGNQLTILPTLTGALQTLMCGSNLLSVLPTLPTSLILLSCSFNPLINLPTLPSSLSYLDCNNATLDSLPSLPSSLSELNCSYNLITNLPPLSSLNILVCNNNQLIDLPILPTSLYALLCTNNNINCFNEFPNTLEWLEIFNNPFTCLPNYLPVMDPITLNYPLCVAGDITNNPFACVAAKGLVGFTYIDANSNCLKDSIDIGLMNIKVQLYDSLSGFLAQTYTASNGVYDFPQPAGTYTIVVDTFGLPISPQCTSPGIDSTVSISTSSPLVSNINFDFNCKPGFDVGVKFISHCGLVFPGTSHTLRINAGDMTQWYNMACASGISGQVQVAITGPVTFSGTTYGALIPSISGSTYTYTIADFGSIINSRDFGLVLTVNPTAGSGNQICVHIDVTPSSGDNDSSNNSFDFCYNVVNSHDPNMKETYPEDIPLNYNSWITYTIQFQNTGTAPALNIHLKDSLDSQLDLSTFEVIGYSHTNTTMLNGNKLIVHFPNINLSDSTSSSDSSKGFFQYRIKPISNLPCGTKIYNTASIYFDYNSPIITNTTINSYPQSPLPLIINDTTICNSSVLTLNISSPGNTINWYDSSNSLLFSGNIYNFGIVTTNMTLYTEVFNINGCSSPTQIVNINVLPYVASPLLSVDDTICYTQTLSLNASSVVGWNYNWTGPSGFISSLQDPIIDSLSQNNSGIYNLYISNTQCVSDTAQVYIQIDTLPILIVTNNPYICLGDSAVLHATGNVQHILWSTGEIGQFIYVSPPETTLYSVDASNTCGNSTNNILVTINMLPTAIANDAILFLGENPQLHAEGGIYYSWFPDYGLSCTDCSDPIVSITEDQSYFVIVTDENGCSDTTSMVVKVKEDVNTIYIPNAFSPNNDGLNDEFKVIGNDIKDVDMIIYARSGDKIFESKNMNVGWNGYYNGKLMSPLVYVYTINVTMKNGDEKKLKGTITLVK